MIVLYSWYNKTLIELSKQLHKILNYDIKNVVTNFLFTELNNTLILTNDK